MADKKKDAPEKEKKKGGKLKLFVILVAVLALLGGGGFAAWKFFLQPKAGGEAHGNQTESADEGGGHDDAGHGGEGDDAKGAQMVTLEPFVVNLSDPMGRRYLKATLDVEVVDAVAAADLTAALPKVKDTLLLLLSSKSFDQISSMDQKIELKNEIVERLNLIIGKSKVRNVYFTEFVVQ